MDYPHDPVQEQFLLSALAPIAYCYKIPDIAPLRPRCLKTRFILVRKDSRRAAVRAWIGLWCDAPANTHSWVERSASHFDAENVSDFIRKAAVVNSVQRVDARTGRLWCGPCAHCRRQI